MEQRVPTRAAVRYRLDYLSLAEFVHDAWPIVEPGTELLWNWHLDLICEHLEAVTRGEEHALALNLPPRYMKSLLVTVMWPCWEWTHRPELRYIFASYSSGLSTSHSLTRRRIMDSEWYVTGMHEHWGHPDFALAGDQNAKTKYENTYRGQMLSTSVGGLGTGEGGDRVIIDDPVNAEDALSDAKRNTANQFFDWTLSTRLNDKTAGAFVLVMQRLHQDDLTGHVIAEGGWTHVCIEGVAENITDVVFPSGRIVHREAGDLLWPDRENAEQIERVRKRLGSYGFAGQYQQRPSPAEGGVFKRAWWVRGTSPATFDRLIQSWDFAFKGEVGSDPVAGFVIGVKGADRWLLDCVNDRLDFVQSCRVLQDITAKWPEAGAKLVEDKANGTAVMSSLARTVTGLIPVEPEGGKLSRAMAIQPEVEAGNWHIPTDAPWAHDFIEQAAAFPNAAHDDMVDAFTQGGNWLARAFVFAP